MKPNHQKDINQLIDIYEELNAELLKTKTRITLIQIEQEKHTEELTQLTKKINNHLKNTHHQEGI